MNNHTASLEITVNVQESVLSRKLFLCFGLVIENIIKYDLYVKFSRIFAHSVQICTKFCCKNFNDVCQVFRILHHYTQGARFLQTRCSDAIFVFLAYQRCRIAINKVDNVNRRWLESVQLNCISVSVRIAQLLWSPYGIGQTIIFLPCDFYLVLFFFPRLFSAAADWMSAILPHMAWRI